MASFATQVQIRRGTDAENDAFTGAEGEVTMDLTNKQLRVHDGQTKGGMKIPNIKTVFDLSSDQTITGKKTFTQGVYAQGRTGMSLANSFSGAPTILAEAKDSAKNISARIVAYYDASNTLILRMLINRNGQDDYFDFKKREDGSLGASFGGATKYLPSTSDNSTNLATTEWVNNFLGQFDYIVSSQEPTEENGYTWYRLYKSGWVEQGGNVNGGTSQTPNFPIEMADTHYAVAYGNMSGTYEQVTTTTKTTTSITIRNANNGGTVSTDWQVSGMSAQ